MEHAELEEALSRKELGNLDSLGRLFAQRHSLIDNIGHFYSRSPRSDVATGILTLATFLADNNEGCCTLSVPRMAKFFARDERRISDAIGRLEAAGVLFVERSPGSSSKCWPVVNRGFAPSSIPLTWFVDARSPRPSAATRPRPHGTPDVNVGGTPLTPDVDGREPLTSTSPNTTKNTTEKEEGVRASFDGTSIRLGSELHSFWLDKFGGDETSLALALIESAAYVQPKSRGAWKRFYPVAGCGCGGGVGSAVCGARLGDQ